MRPRTPLTHADIKTADWSEEVAPFWGEVIKTAFTSEGIAGLLKAGWTTIKGALVVSWCGGRVLVRRRARAEGRRWVRIRAGRAAIRGALVASGHAAGRAAGLRAALFLS